MRRYLLIVAPLLLASRGVAQPPSFEGLSILAVEYVPEKQPLAIEDLQANQLVRTGSPLKYSDVAATIDRLFATGRYEDIQVEAEPKDNGVVGRFGTRNTWVLSHVQLHGPIKNTRNRRQ